MPDIIINSFHHGINQVSQPTTKRKEFADAAPNCVLSTRNAVTKRGGSAKISASQYAGGAEIRSMFDFQAHGGNLVHKYIFNAATSLYELHLGSGVAGAIKGGLTSGLEFQYVSAGQTLYMGNGAEMLKMYRIAEYGLGGDLAVTKGAVNHRLAQSFVQGHGNNRVCSSISLPLIRTGAISAGINLTVEISADSGGVPGAVISNGTSQTIPATNIPTVWEWVPFTFATRPTLNTATTYWVVLRASTEPLGGSEGTIDWAVDSTVSVSGYDDGQWATHNGSSWSADATKDGLFAVFVEPDNWGIVAPATSSTLALAATQSGPSYTSGDDTETELTDTGKLAQSFTSTIGTNISRVRLKLNKVGTPTGSASVRIEEDNAGVPSGTLVGEASQTLDISTLATTPGGLVNFNFTNAVSIEASKTYWIVLISSYEAGGYTATTKAVRWRTDNSSPAYADGKFAVFISSWAANSGIDGLFDTSLASKWSDGGRSYRVSFKNSVTGHISNPSTATPYSGNTIGNTITVDNFPTTTDVQVDKIVIWATTDGGGIWWFLDEINYPGAAYTDDSSDDELNYDREAPFDNYPPAAGFLVERVRNQILLAGVAANPHRVFYSGSLGQILEGVPEESFPPLNFQSVPSGSERIYALGQIDNIPVVWSTDQIFAIFGETPESFRLGQFRGGESIGTKARTGVIKTEKGLFFISTDKKVYLIPTVNHIPTLVSEIIEDELEDISSGGSVIAVSGFEKIRLQYIKFGDMNWLILAIPTGLAGNNELWVYDTELHDQHPGLAWMGPWTLKGAEPFQTLAVLTDHLGNKRLYAADDSGYIRELNTGNQDDGENIVSSYTFPWLDGDMPNVVKDAITVEVTVPAAQTVPTLAVSIDTESNYTNVALTAVNEMERGASTHRYRGLIAEHFTRIKPRITFAAENAAGELWQLQIHFEPLFEVAGALHDA